MLKGIGSTLNLEVILRKRGITGINNNLIPNNNMFIWSVAQHENKKQYFSFSYNLISEIRTFTHGKNVFMT
jgi:hypothetical protein